MLIGSQYISLGIAVVTFLVALLPRNYSEENSRHGQHHLSIWPRLLRFPLFWIRLALVVMVIIQGLNPAWHYVSSSAGWWMEMNPYIEWLPHGTELPAKLGNPWRSLLVIGATWLIVCSLWIGITRRRSLQIILATLAGNAFLLAIIAGAQRLTQTNKILWFIDSPNQI